jgi:hypothetical protein
MDRSHFFRAPDRLRFPVPGLLVIALLLLPAWGCSFYESSVSVELSLPPFPEHWQTTIAGLRFRIVHPAPGREGFAEMVVDPFERPEARLPKLLHLPVLAYPALPDFPGRPSTLPPAGGLYPLDCEAGGSVLCLSWERGAVAEVVRRLREQGIDGSACDVPRLGREMASRCGGDPWALDLQRICTALADGRFRVTDIRPAPSRDLLLRPGAGRWFLESPFRRPEPAGADGSVFLPSVALGAHYLFESDSASVLFLYVEEHTVLLSPR